MIAPGTVRSFTIISRRLNCFVWSSSGGRILQSAFMKKSGHGVVSQFSISRSSVEIKN